MRKTDNLTDKFMADHTNIERFEKIAGNISNLGTCKEDHNNQNLIRESLIISEKSAFNKKNN